eukprot:7156203-Lingulodinium_polyedra.AAC.1
MASSRARFAGTKKSSAMAPKALASGSAPSCASTETAGNCSRRSAISWHAAATTTSKSSST